MDRFTRDNTQGYTLAELALLNDAYYLCMHSDDPENDPDHPNHHQRDKAVCERLHEYVRLGRLWGPTPVGPMTAAEIAAQAD